MTITIEPAQGSTGIVGTKLEIRSPKSGKSLELGLMNLKRGRVISRGRNAWCVAVGCPQPTGSLPHDCMHCCMAMGHAWYQGFGDFRMMTTTGFTRFSESCDYFNIGNNTLKIFGALRAQFEIVIIWNSFSVLWFWNKTISIFEIVWYFFSARFARNLK